MLRKSIAMCTKLLSFYKFVHEIANRNNFCCRNYAISKKYKKNEIIGYTEKFKILYKLD